MAYQSEMVISSQPQVTINNYTVTSSGSSDWSSNVCDCCDDCGICESPSVCVKLCMHNVCIVLSTLFKNP